jgi:hypothetical protein
MSTRTTLAAAAMFALGGCDMIVAGFAGADNAGIPNGAEAANANAAAVAGDKRPEGGDRRIADAGVTTSRSLQAFAGVAPGGKDPLNGGAGLGGLSPQALVGRWADDVNCQMDINIFADGTFRSFNGGSGNWRLNGDMLQLSGDGGTFTLRIQAFDGQSMQVVNPDGSVGRSIRC